MGEDRMNNAKNPSLDVFKVAELLISRSLASHGEEIDLIAYYGSYAQGRATATSDLDIFYVPAEGKNPPAGHTFLLQGRLFDFWGISWETLDGLAMGCIRGWSFAPAIVHHAKVLYARSDEQVKRFEALKQKVIELQSPEARPQMIQRALDEYKTVLAQLGNLRLAAIDGDVADLRYAGWKLALSCWECLALANQTFCEQGWGHMLEDIPRLKQRPSDLEVLIVALSSSAELDVMLEAGERLALGTRKVLHEMQKSLVTEGKPSDVFEGSYPEIKDGLRKVLKACEQGAMVSASVAAWYAQAELSMMLHELHNSSNPGNFNLYSEFASPYRGLGFPDLMQIKSSDMTALAGQVRLLDEKLQAWLREKGVNLGEFETLEELEATV